VLIVSGREIQARQHEALLRVVGHDAGAGEAAFDELPMLLDVEAARRLCANVALAALLAEQGLHGILKKRDLRGQAGDELGMGGGGDGL